jgi:putative protease
VDALILADMGVLDYAAQRHPDLKLHLSVQGSATSPAAIRFMHRHFGIRRVVVPRVLSIAQVAHLIKESPVPIEIFGFGSLCVMVEGRCLLSSYATGQSPNTFGACSPAAHVEWRDTPAGQETRLGGVLIERRGRDEPAGYPTICKGRYEVQGDIRYAIEEPTSLNTLDLLPEILAAGVAAIKLEGRQRSTRYVTEVTRVWREAIDSCKRNPAAFRPKADWMQTLARVSEGTQTTIGPYERTWH